MAGRPKQGIDYSGWSVDIFDGDKKIDKLLDAKGWKGFGIYFFLCQRAYKVNGYFYEWGYDDCATTARRMGGGISSGTVKETVDYCLQVDLFDKGLFDRWGILTSRGIQRRFWAVLSERRSKTVYGEYWLLKPEECKGLVKVSLFSDVQPTNDDVQGTNEDSLYRKESKVKKSNVYLDELKDDAALHVIVANPQDRKIYVPYELNMICDKGQKDPVLCIEVGQPQDMDAELVEAAMEDERAAQPELQKLKNNEERKEFLAKYREWPVWFEVPQAEETYYRYILPDGSAIVICEYKHYNEWWENKYVPGEPEGTLTVEYLLEPGYKHLHNCKTNQTALIRKLMEVQRNGQ